jgi:hypothetical protein
VAKQHPFPRNVGGPAVTHCRHIHAPRALAATGALSEARGILYARPCGDKASFEAYDIALLRVLGELGLTSLPVITRMDFGHTDPKFVLPTELRWRSTVTVGKFGFSKHPPCCSLSARNQDSRARHRWTAVLPEACRPRRRPPDRDTGFPQPADSAHAQMYPSA